MCVLNKGKKKVNPTEKVKSNQLLDSGVDNFKDDNHKAPNKRTLEVDNVRSQDEATNKKPFKKFDRIPQESKGFKPKVSPPPNESGRAIDRNQGFEEEEDDGNVSDNQEELVDPTMESLESPHQIGSRPDKSQPNYSKDSLKTDTGRDNANKNSSKGELQGKNDDKTKTLPI